MVKPHQKSIIDVGKKRGLWVAYHSCGAIRPIIPDMIEMGLDVLNPIQCNWPFPKYENGDLFLSWGYLGVRSYLKYDKAIALKFIKNILEQYSKDVVSSQRYRRVTQKGQKVIGI